MGSGTLTEIEEFVARTRDPRWMNVALLGVIAAAMFATLFLVYQTVESERAQREQVRRTVEVLEELRQVNRSVLSGETGQRGYLITLDRRYLAPYQAGRGQIELIDQIDALARAKFDEMAESVELLEDGRLLDARRAVLTDEGIESMERLVRAIAEMEDIENEILADHSAEAARSEARVLALLGALLVLLVLAMFAGTRLVGRAARAEAEAAQAAIVSEARDRADLLARELNHRVKNLFAVILAIVQMSARDKPEAKEVTDSIAQRIRALLTAHEVSQGELERPVASLRALVETSLAPYRSNKHPAQIDGPEILLPAKQVTPLGLVLHELTTNAVKYGAWKNEGTVHVSWTKQDGTVILSWRESGAELTEMPERKGFGSLLMTSAARQFGGTFDRSFADDGLQVTIKLPTDD